MPYVIRLVCNESQRKNVRGRCCFAFVPDYFTTSNHGVSLRGVRMLLSKQHRRAYLRLVVSEVVPCPVMNGASFVGTLRLPFSGDAVRARCLPSQQ